jgi:acyl-CoA hydrolase
MPTSGVWRQVVSEAQGQKRGVAPSQTSAHMTQLIMPQYANSLGITFGGQACSSRC